MVSWEAPVGEARLASDRSTLFRSSPDRAECLVQQRFLLWLAASALFVPLILWSDGPGWIRQMALAVCTAAFLWLLVRASSVEVPLVITAILVATAGEGILSLGWGLYRYRFALLPLYVPAGHGLFFTLAAWSSRQEALRRHEQRVYRAVLACGSLAAIASLLVWNDQWGLIWWLLAAALLMRSKSRLLLSLCFVYTVALEWLGTSIGNWRWMPTVPGLGLRCANPPSGVGVLYIVLDLVTVAIFTLRWGSTVADNADRTKSPLLSA
jgi:hypothetical protein